MRYASVCSGIEAATVAWHPLGWEPMFFAEIEKFPCKVLVHHYPCVPNLGDMTKIDGTGWRGKIDLLVGGTPCQDFSVAGKRAGFEGARGGLTYEYVRLLREARPEWFVWENVPGVLQGKMQDGFIGFLRSIAELGYHLEWRTLDAQYVRVDGFPGGVPQRRRRVFVVGHLGGCGGQPILFEPQSLCGDSAPRRKAREETSGVACEGIDHELNGFDTAGVCGPLMKDSPTGGGRPLPAICMATGSANAEITRGFCPTLTCVHDGSPIVCTQYGHVAGTLTARHNSSPCADRGQNVIAIAGNTTVRRLTPRECERLQGFPDDYTLVPGSSDSARYKALGNSMAVNVMRWIGKRISNHPANWLS